jgi:glycosyltransferase involved in cell wall biosynthesis
MMLLTRAAFASAIIKLMDNPEQAAEMGQKGREWVIKNSTYEILARQVEERFLELVSKN